MKESCDAALPTPVVELACGKGFDTRYLAERHPGIRFEGIDLTDGHIDVPAEHFCLQQHFIHRR